MDHEQLLIFASAYAISQGKDFALLGSPFPFTRNKFSAGLSGIKTDESPIANILHAEDEDLEDLALYVSCKPSEMDLGLAWRSKVSAIFWLEFPHTYRIYSVGDEGPASRTCSTMKRDDAIAALNNPVERAKLIDRIKLADKRIKAAIDAPKTSRPLSDIVTSRLKLGLAGRKPVLSNSVMSTENALMRVVYALVSCGWNELAPRGERYINIPRPFGNNIGGIILDANQQIIAWGLNMKEINKTFHAETMMILAYLRRHNVDRLPAGCTVYTSLECCYMCAGHITTLGQDIKVIYGQKDPNIAGDNALARGVNGCSQRATALPYATFLGRAQGNQNIIDFLFAQDPVRPNVSVRTTQQMFSRPMLDNQLFRELGRRTGNIQTEDHFSVAKEGEKFLGELQAAGLLHGLLL